MILSSITKLAPGSRGVVSSGVSHELRPHLYISRGERTFGDVATITAVVTWWRVVMQ